MFLCKLFGHNWGTHENDYADYCERCGEIFWDPDEDPAP